MAPDIHTSISWNGVSIPDYNFLRVTINNHMYRSHDAVSERGPSITKGLFGWYTTGILVDFTYKIPYMCKKMPYKGGLTGQNESTTRWATGREHRSAVGMGRSAPPKDESNFKEPPTCKSSGDNKYLIYLPHQASEFWCVWMEDHMGGKWVSGWLLSDVQAAETWVTPV